MSCAPPLGMYPVMLSTLSSPTLHAIGGHAWLEPTPRCPRRVAASKAVHPGTRPSSTSKVMSAKRRERVTSCSKDPHRPKPIPFIGPRGTEPHREPPRGGTQANFLERRQREVRRIHLLRGWIIIPLAASACPGA